MVAEWYRWRLVPVFFFFFFFVKIKRQLVSRTSRLGFRLFLLWHVSSDRQCMSQVLFPLISAGLLIFRISPVKDDGGNTVSKLFAFL